MCNTQRKWYDLYFIWKQHVHSFTWFFCVFKDLAASSSCSCLKIVRLFPLFKSRYNALSSEPDSVVIYGAQIFKSAFVVTALVTIRCGHSPDARSHAVISWGTLYSQNKVFFFWLFLGLVSHARLLHQCACLDKSRNREIPRKHHTHLK